MIGNKTPRRAIRRLQRELYRAGWDPRDIAWLLLRLYPEELSRLSALRYGYGWSSQEAVDRIRANVRRPSYSRNPNRPVGLDVTRLNEWEHWPQSGVRPGLVYQEAASRTYRVAICELGLTDCTHQEFPMRYSNLPEDDVARIIEAAIVVVRNHPGDPAVLQSALNGVAQMVGVVGKVTAGTAWADPFDEQTARSLYAWSAVIGMPPASGAPPPSPDGS